MRKWNHQRGLTRTWRRTADVQRPRCSRVRRERRPLSPLPVAESAEPAPAFSPIAVIRISSAIIIVVGVPGPG